MPENLHSVSVVGLGKLGFGLALAFASRGFRVLGVDVNKKVTDSIRHGISPLVEPETQALLNKVRARFQVTENHADAINLTNVTIVLVATPSDRKGNFSNMYVETALKSLAAVLKKSEKKYHLFIVSSTVMPSSVEARLIPIIENFSGRELNKGFGVSYIPDFVALGSVVSDFLNPDFVLIGESDRRAGNIASAMYKKMVKNGAPIHRMSIINAEIAKVALNCYVTMKISFANLLGNICEEVVGGEADKITGAIGADRRIGARYFRSGLSFGGTCFPRDTKAFIAFARHLGVDTGIVSAVDKFNDLQHKRLLNTVDQALQDRRTKKLSVLGLAFKPNTPVVEASPGIELIRRMLSRRKDAIITAYDPLANDAAQGLFSDRIRYTATLNECLRASPVWVITTPDKAFKKIGHKSILTTTTIIDCWRILQPSVKKQPGITYIGMGVGKNTE